MQVKWNNFRNRRFLTSFGMTKLRSCYRAIVLSLNRAYFCFVCNESDFSEVTLKYIMVNQLNWLATSVYPMQRHALISAAKQH